MKATYADVRAAYPASDVERHKVISPYSYYVLGVLSLRLTPLFINLGLRANTVTALGFVVALLIQPVIVLGALDPLYFVVASLLVHVFYLLDNIDGHIARFHRNSSYVGSLLDPLASWVQRTLFPVSLGLALYFSPSYSIYAFGLTVPAWAWIAVGITRMYAYLLTIAIGSKTDALLATEALTVGSKGGRFTIVAKGIVELEPVFLIAAVPVGAVWGTTPALRQAATVPSGEASSTTTISSARNPAANKRAMLSPMIQAALKAGTITVIAGDAALIQTPAAP